MDYWPLFVEFCQAELATGGPDPQIATIAHLSRHESDVEKVWAMGCYGAHHCVPSGFLTWKAFRAEQAVAWPEQVRDWLDNNWDYLPVRPEMRSHRMLEKRTRCLVDFAKYAICEKWREPDYDTVWVSSISNVKFYARYMAIKFLEYLGRTVNTNLILTDLRAGGAWSPRRTLSWLYPDARYLADKDDNSRNALDQVEYHAGLARTKLEAFGVNVNFFQLQVMLCEFREALVGGYYPGGSLDEELDYIKISHRNPRPGFNTTPILEARREIFAHEYLGEVGGWDGIRKEKFTEWKERGWQLHCQSIDDSYKGEDK